jgi:hypothetical protein
MHHIENLYIYIYIYIYIYAWELVQNIHYIYIYAWELVQNIHYIHQNYTYQWQAAPFSRKDIDSINDETFGSSEGSNEERVEEEKTRG